MSFFGIKSKRELDGALLKERCSKCGGNLFLEYDSADKTLTKKCLLCSHSEIIRDSYSEKKANKTYKR